MIKLTAKIPFKTHKKAENEADCQDACSLNDKKGRYAIADGATRSFFPKEWATLLVEHFCKNTDLPLTERNWQDWIDPIRQKWYKQIEKTVKKRNLFYLTNSFNVKESALSTFIGLKFNKDNGEWRAMIVGDSCLFHIRGPRFKSYLVGKSADFTNRSEVFASFAKDNYSKPLFEGGQAKPDDIFILATDALAKWMLEHQETEKLKEARNRLEQIKTNAEFCKFINHARMDEDIRLVNDDVTLIIILVEAVQE